MHPAFLDSMSWEMAEVYGAVTDRILINLARHFPYFEAGEPVPMSAFTYQTQMLAQMGQVSAETVQIIRNSLSDADLALYGALEQAIIDAVRTSEPELLEGVRKGVFQFRVPPVLAPNQYRAFNLYYQQAADKLNLVNTVMLESTKSAYQQTITDVVSEIELAERINATYTALDAATGEVVTGVSSWNQALRHATDRLKDRGITGFIDHAGRQWSAEGYVAMDIRTTMFNTGRAAVWETNQSFGNDLYSVSYHNGARPLCYPYQNKVISSTDNARTVVDLDGNEIEVLAQSATSYGQPAGLFGINCKHYPTPFIPGVSVIEGQPQSKEENDKTYAESQEQRGLERKMREQKRDLLMAKAQGADDEEIKRLSDKCHATSEEIDDFCNRTGRARHRDREAVYTKREFPDAKRYNVAEFKDTQQQIINNWYQQGGAQTGYTFGQMTPTTPIVPATPPAPVANVASQATKQAFGNDMFANVQGVDDSFRQEMAKALLASGNDEAINLYGKYADQLKVIDQNYRGTAKFNRISGGVFMNAANVAKETLSDYPYETAFHEFGHMIDWLANGKDRFDYLSNLPINGDRLQDVIKSDYMAFRKAEKLTSHNAVIMKLKAENMSFKANGCISDMLEYCMNRNYPLGTGHGAAYHKRYGATEREFFAEVLECATTNPEGYEQMKRLFPNAVDMVWQMIKGVI